MKSVVRRAYAVLLGELSNFCERGALKMAGVFRKKQVGRPEISRGAPGRHFNVPSVSRFVHFTSGEYAAILSCDSFPVMI